MLNKLSKKVIDKELNVSELMKINKELSQEISKCKKEEKSLLEVNEIIENFFFRF